MLDGERNLLTLDIEDWCQSSTDLLAAADGRPRPLPPSERVLDNTRLLLRLLAAHGARATCFVLGTVAETYPQLVREICDAGHEVATHGYGHDPVYRLSREEFAADLDRSIDALEAVTGERVIGYRAPYFSVTPSQPWVFEVLAERGLEYDSSTYPIHRSLYGYYPGWRGGSTQRLPHRVELSNGRSLVELPCSTVRWAGQYLPIGGGGTLRLVPARLWSAAIRHLNDSGWPAVVYLHPFDLDAEELRGRRPAEPWRARLLRWLLNFNRAGNEAKLSRLLAELRFTSIADALARAGVTPASTGSARAASAG